ncbi:aldehyde dehydrogenase family protein [uncultured Bartonella sp.]|uniref:aldehyde dehydrogenase family protein n=1 Tax=uncultured Bartonella sp. TaxID=104108 RepID=UPI0025D610C1|nr:aldehyde dehydrogenase family protein [uncultured Bartonella sp.]
MTELKTSQYYHELADKLKFPTNAFIDDAFVNSVAGDRFVTRNPATGQELATIANCHSEDVDIAVKAARKSFDNGVWRKRTPLERKLILLKFADLLEKHSEELAVLESLDSGKPVGECMNGDIPDTIYTIRWHAELIDKIYDNRFRTHSHGGSPTYRRCGAGFAVEFSAF